MSQRDEIARIIDEAWGRGGLHFHFVAADEILAAGLLVPPDTVETVGIACHYPSPSLPNAVFIGERVVASFANWKHGKFFKDWLEGQHARGSVSQAAIDTAASFLDTQETP